MYDKGYLLLLDALNLSVLLDERPGGTRAHFLSGLIHYPFSPSCPDPEWGCCRKRSRSDATRYQIDLQVANKPEWTNMGVQSRTPSTCCPSQPKSPKSPVLLEFIADLYRDFGLLPKEPVSRAHVVPPPQRTLLPRRGVREARIDAFIPAVPESRSDSRQTRSSQLGITSRLIAPFLGRWQLLLQLNLDKFAEGTGLRVYEELFRSERIAQTFRSTM
ncbi:hypothetical protein EI94DRAFT_1705488 [Lactarius quietus]|nr:hypothetical protein EI94DRAFT_1705488 [Lactarius quietus]